MATDLTDLEGKIFLDCSMTAKKALDLSTPTDALGFRAQVDFTFSETTQIFHDQYTIAASGTQTLDLVDILNPFTTACNFANLSAVIIRNQSALAEIEVGGGTFAGWMDAAANVETVKAVDGVMVHVNTVGWSVGPGADEILITNTDGVNAATVDVVLIGSAG